jgi:hypothetical protein
MVRSSKTSVLTRSTWCNIPEDTILHSHHREKLKSYLVTSFGLGTGWSVPKIYANPWPFVQVTSVIEKSREWGRSKWRNCVIVLHGIVPQIGNTEESLQVIHALQNSVGWQSDEVENNNLCWVRFEVFTAVTMKNAVFWDVTPCGSCKNWCLGGTQRRRNIQEDGVLHSHCRKNLKTYIALTGWAM